MHGIEIRQFTHSAEIKRETPFCMRKRSETYIFFFSFDKVHVSCMDIYQQRLQCHSFCAILTMLHYLFQYPVERGIPVRQYSLSTVVVGYPSVTIDLIMTDQVF